MPALLVTLIGTAILSALILSPMHLEQFGGSLFAASLGVANMFFWLEADYFDTASQLKPLLHTWSLGVEEQFYLFWPLFLALAYKGGLKRPLPVIIIIVGLVSLLMNMPFSDGQVYRLTSTAPRIAEYFTDGKSSLFFLLPFRVYEFAIGGFMVWAVRYMDIPRTVLDTMFLAGVALVAWSITTFNESMLFPMSAALAPCGGAALLIASGAGSRFSVLLTHRAVVFVGLISYSLYLVHWPVTVAWLYLFGEPGIAAVAGLTLISVFLAWVSWRYVEKPFRNPTFWSAHKAVYVAGPLLFISTLAVGWHMDRSGGWKFRVPHTIANIDLTGNSAAYHRIHYGGEGYPWNSGVHTDVPADIVLIGDSHGRQYAEGLYEELAKPRGLSLYVSAGTSCYYLPGFTRRTVGTDWNMMAPRALKNALDIIRTADKPPVVVVAHSWFYQSSVGALLADDGSVLDRPLTDEDVIAGLLALKREIGDAPLVVIGNVPTTNGIDLYDAFTRPWPVQRYVNDPSKYASSTPDDRYRAFNEVLRRASQDTGAFTFLDPFDVLCDDGACRNLDDNNRLLYSDTAHLSKVGSRLVVSNFLPTLNIALASTSRQSP